MHSEKTPDDGQRNCPKHAEFYSKSKFEELVHIVRFVIRICKLRFSLREMGVDNLSGCIDFV